jgi:hypothetical protein
LFGINQNTKEALVFEPIFSLIYWCGFSYTEAYNLYFPVAKWFIERITKELNKKENGEDGGQTSRGTQHNTPIMRKLQGFQRENVPARLRRQT